MSKNNMPGGDNGYDAEEMTVDLDLEDGTTVTCAVITILTVSEKDYIVLLPLDESGENTEGEVWFYRYSENPDDPNEEPVLDYIEDDDEYEAVAEALTSTWTPRNSTNWWAVRKMSHSIRHARNREGASFPVFPLTVIRHRLCFALVMAT